MIMINEVEHKLNAELMDRIRRIKHIALDMDAKHAQSHTQFAAFKRMFFVGVIMAAALVLPQYVHPIGVVFGIVGLKITALMYPKLHPVIQKYRKKRL